MYLKRLELSGFKSFAKATALEFPSRITAVVGPNGSGKSNIKEAIQWVLGEQSMKSLRAKLGEDLIWNGSPEVPRVGKASVALHFDNKEGKIPLDFDEVVISRKIFRDGLNEYYFNNSQVRLKDVVELLARMSLGETKHNIIGQGEVDRILLSTPRDRREMLEEALGLRVYQLKKNEAERKLDATENNMKHVEALAREIAPTLKFLKQQAQKAEAREGVENELKELQKVYFTKEDQEIRALRKDIETRRAPFIKKKEEALGDISKLEKEIGDMESVFSRSVVAGDGESKLISFESRRRELERELGRLEGKLEVERERPRLSTPKSVDIRYIKDEIKEFLAEIRVIIEEEDQMDMVRSHLFVLIEDMENLLNQMERGFREEKPDAPDLVKTGDLEKTIRSLGEELEHIGKEIEKLARSRTESRQKDRELQLKIRELDSMLRIRRDEDRGVSLNLERFKFDEEKAAFREEAFLKELREAGMERKDVLPFLVEKYKDTSVEELGRKIERIRGKLEEIGGIDLAVIREYQDVEARHSFLIKELDDLKQAHVSLKILINELEDRVKHDFKAGFAKIREEFLHLFRLIFGGGKASLQLIEPKIKKIDADAGEGVLSSAEPEEEGIDILVELPGKRIKGLAMLSGGERALTSIALLFAITAVSPPPFLILDETDAALDEANSQRYGSILKELAKKTQLVIVTHNRETMKVADVLYGVTMGNDGVSKLLSLKFGEAEVYTNRG